MNRMALHLSPEPARAGDCPKHRTGRSRMARTSSRGGVRRGRGAAEMSLLPVSSVTARHADCQGYAGSVPLP